MRVIKLNNSLKPKSDELLTSWVGRYSLSYGLTPYNFLKYAFDCPKLSILDFDRNIKERELELISKHSGISKPEIRSQTIVGYTEKIIDTSVKQIHFLYKDILPKSKKGINGLMFCPLCLREDPYFKISWRLTLNVSCPIHKIRLQNQCPHCHEPIRLELLNCFLRDVSFCFSCWRSLISPQSYQLADDEVLWLSEVVNLSIRTGWVYLKSNNHIFAPIWFNGVWVLINVFYSKRKNIDYFREACSFFGLENEQHLSQSRNWKRFGSEELSTRYVCLRLVAKMIKDWPISFINLSKGIGITKAVLNPHGIEIPYWLHKIVNKDIHTYKYRVTDEEIKSALEYMINNGIPICKTTLAKVLGNDESMKLNTRRKKILEQYKNKFF